MFSRRSFALAAAALGLAAPARAQGAFPARTVTIVMPYPPGNAVDLLSRALATAMTPLLGQTVVVLTRDGAAAAVGASFVARAPADGYTLLFAPALVSSTLPIVMPNSGLQTNSLRPICQVFNNTMALVVKPDSPIRTLADLQAAAQARPGRITYGTLGVTSIPHLAMVQWANAARAEVEHVPYRADGMVMTEVLTGRIDVGAIVLGSAAGRTDLRVLATFDTQRHPDFPDAPTATEQGFAVAPASFGGLFAPAGTPDDRIATLAAACTAAAAGDLYRGAARSGSQPSNYFLPQAEFTRRLAEDVAQKAEVLRGITLN